MGLTPTSPNMALMRGRRSGYDITNSDWRWREGKRGKRGEKRGAHGG